MMNLDEIHKAGVMKLWRELEGIDKLITISLEKSYSKSFFDYLRHSLILIEFIKAKPMCEKKRALVVLEENLSFCRNRGYSDLAGIYGAEIDFFRNEFVFSKYNLD